MFLFLRMSVTTHAFEIQPQCLNWDTRLEMLTEYHRQFPALTINASLRLQYSSIIYSTCHIYKKQTSNWELCYGLRKFSRVRMVTMESWGKELKQRKTLLGSLAALVLWKCRIDSNVPILYFVGDDILTLWWYFKPQARVVQRLNNAIHRINHYAADSVVCFVKIYPLDSDLSGG